jgi:hypothetical protein
MHSKFILFCIALMFIRCSSSVEQKKPTVVQEEKPLSIEKESIQVYQLQENALLDSLLFPIEEFTLFRSTIEDLSKLNPAGLEPFLYDALLKCNDLLRQKLPVPFSTPDIHSRLKVVKTELIKARYYGQEADQEQLNESLKKLYKAYKAYLMRIEDFAVEVKEENNLEVNKPERLEVSRR